METQAEKTGKPMVGGILLIVSAAFSLIGAVIMIIYSFFVFDMFFSMSGVPVEQNFIFNQFTQFIQSMYLGWAFILIVLTVLSLIGGINALKRKHWGWVLAGSIASVAGFFPVGIAAIILVAQARSEFGQAIQEPPGSS